VHAVLQHADLDDPGSADLTGLARWQCAVEGLAPDVAPVVEAKVRAAIGSPLVGRAVRSGRLHRELLVAAPLASVLRGAGAGALGVGDRDAQDAELVEGFVDLCFEEEGGLVVVDYKTDDVPSDDAVAAALDRYTPQGAAYALLLEAATGLPVTEVHFLFLRGAEAVDERVRDLGAAKAAVIRTLTTPTAGAA